MGEMVLKKIEHSIEFRLKWESHSIPVQLLKCFNKFIKALAVICLVSTEDAEILSQDR